MEYVKLGNSGLEVSQICLGCMGFGDPNNWVHSWVLEENESRNIIKKALDLGINFFDTANVYSLGVSEKILGAAIKDYAVRENVVVATKVSGKMLDGPNGGGLSRKAIMQEVNKSLERLDMDYIDLLIIHRWDYNTPIEETMEALHDLVKMGKVHYIGASAMYAWQFQKAQYVAQMHNWTRFISMQNHYNLLYREEEREMLPLCDDLGVGITPYSPLAAGRLTRDIDATTTRSKTDKIAIMKYDSTMNEDKAIIERVAALANELQVPRASIALAWLLHKSPVKSLIIGASKISHLEDAIKATEIVLTQKQIDYLEEEYRAHSVMGPNSK